MLQAGSRDAYLIQQPLAAALRVALPISSPSGNMVICMGGGATQAAVISMYGIVAAETMRSGRLLLDDAIVTYVRRKYGVIIGPATAEQLKFASVRPFRRIKRKAWKCKVRTKSVGCRVRSP